MKRGKNIVDLEHRLINGIVLATSDWHVPFQDDKYVQAFIKYAKKKQPDTIILNGDMLDFFMLSKFTKGEGRNPYQEITILRKYLQQLRAACPKSVIFYVIGNHETRLERYVLSKAPELQSLIEDVFTIVKTKDFNIHGCGSVLVNNTFIFKHGTLLGNKSGLSAIKEMENAYMSGCSGHTHRAAKYIARKAGRKFVWLESGCGCSLEPEYMINPNWQQALCEFTFEKGKLKHSKVLEVEDGTILE